MRVSVYTRRLAVVAVAVVTLSTGTAAFAAPAANNVPAGMVTAGQANQPIHAADPVGIKARAKDVPACKTRCVRVEPAPASSVPAASVRRLARSAAAADTNFVPWPDWCDTNINQGIFYDRTEACESRAIDLQTIQYNDDEEVLVGELLIAFVSYSYLSTTSSSWVHEVLTQAMSGWGDATGAAVTAVAESDFGCRSQGYTFDGGAMLPFHTARTGVADFTAASTATGSIGYCTTEWSLIFDVPTYNLWEEDLPTVQVRCDNATGGASSPGCVFPDYPSALIYSISANPSMALHVFEAQQSGLPGGSYDAPLTRNTDDILNDANREEACGDAPSITGLSCDEYPPASSQQGLAFEEGADRRTSEGCYFDDLPIDETGPYGVSVCMIDGADQDAQGGLNSQFYRSNRVLDGDPFVIFLSN
jgi:hypothetical protein